MKIEEPIEEVKTVEDRAVQKEEEEIVEIVPSVKSEKKKKKSKNKNKEEVQKQPVEDEPAVVRPKVVDPEPVEPENLAKRDVKTGSKLVLADAETQKSEAESKETTKKTENYFKVDKSEK